MRRQPITAEPPGPTLSAHLLGTIDYELCLALQQRLVYEVGGRRDGHVELLLCEHPGTITVGRRGSWGHVRFTEHDLLARKLHVRWVNRGDGAVLHLPGVLEILPIVPLDWHGMTVGEYLDRLQTALAAVLTAYQVPLTTRPGRHGIWGRSGQLASIGIAVKNWIAYHGATLNISAALGPFGYVQSDPEGATRFGSLLAECRRPVKMTTVRTDVIHHLAAALSCTQLHVFTGHPLLTEIQRVHRQSSRVG